MIVAGNELDPKQTALNQAVQKRPPVHFGLGQRDRYTKHSSVAAGGDAHGDQHCAVHYLAGFSHALLARIQQQVGCFLQRTITPSIKALVELLRAATDLGR